ncbi:PAP2 superfamily-domain-containing protein [Xylogone sp. PMI_703]|nr:PAP2 superfamily-domain-containing protein [Xylogone sp. PMI_703]
MGLEANITVPIGEPEWNSEAAWKLPGWFEPILVASILVGAMFFTRRRGFQIFRTKKPHSGILNDDPDSNSARSSDDLLSREHLYDDLMDDIAEDPIFTGEKHPPKRRRCCGLDLYTPNTSQFANHFHSRIMQKFPFLMEMFYWIITYAFYRSTSILSQAVFSKTSIWDVAQDHALAILEFEEFSWLSFLWPVRERDVQQWFMHGHQTFLTVLNRSYALIHIPGTVGFIAWYYYIAPSHNTFAIVRRTMTLTNLLAFCIFVFYPCMPPRLLPPEYGFLDSVRHDDAQSVWMSGKYVNSLAAMPSMHFGYSFCIGSTLVYQSGIFRRKLEPGETRKSKFWILFYLLLGIGYPTWILTTIVATANHYFMDACVATLVAITAFFCNRIFLVLLPLEDLLLWCLRLEKPMPSTGERNRRIGRRVYG